MRGRSLVLLFALLAGCIKDLDALQNGDGAIDAGPESGAPEESDAGTDAPMTTDDATPAPTGDIKLAQTVAGDEDTEDFARTFEKPITAGNTIIVVAFVQFESDMMVDDSDGNAYTALKRGGTNNSLGELQIFYAANAKAGRPTVTLHVSNGNQTGFVAMEYSGLDGTVEDQTDTFEFGEAEVESEPLKSTGGLIVAGVVNATLHGRIQPGPDWTAISTNESFFWLTQSRAVPPGSYPITATMPAGKPDWALVGASFKRR